MFPFIQIGNDWYKIFIWLIHSGSRSKANSSWTSGLSYSCHKSIPIPVFPLVSQSLQLVRETLAHEKCRQMLLFKTLICLLLVICPKAGHLCLSFLIYKMPLLKNRSCFIKIIVRTPWVNVLQLLLWVAGNDTHR